MAPELKTTTWQFLDHHGTFVFYIGAGVVGEVPYDFSLIDIRKAVLKLKQENIPPAGCAGLVIEYFDEKTLSWKEMGRIDKWWGGENYGEFDVTAICRNYPSGKMRGRVNIWYPWAFYYSCLRSRAALYFEYYERVAGGAPTGQPKSSEEAFGYVEFASVAQMMDTMMQFMFMFMMMSMMMSVMTAMSEAMGKM